MHKEMLDTPGHKGNVNQNCLEISPHYYQNGYHEDHKQQQILVRMQRKEEPLHTVGWNVD
jgi:hypothetical protein